MRLLRKTITVLGLISLVFASCEKEEEVPKLPTITTTVVSDIQIQTAVSGGEITDNGGAEIIMRGVCWREEQNPTITDNKTENGIGDGSFISPITELEVGKTYYVRAYATNVVGTNYGNEESFTVPTSGAYTDTRDNNIYKWTKIGDQIWMTENLAYLPKVHSNVDFANKGNNKEPAYCVYDYTGSDVSTAKAQDNYKTYGVLYNFYVIDQTNVCPDGWHVPTDDEWATLLTYLGGEAGGKLKERGTTHWHTPNTGATNEMSFTALPGGNCFNNGSFVALGFTGYWWSSTENDDIESYQKPAAWYLNLYYLSNTLNKNSGDKDVGLSIRCIKD